jgi:hypothetical protein
MTIARRAGICRRAGRQAGRQAGCRWRRFESRNALTLMSCASSQILIALLSSFRARKELCCRPPAYPPADTRRNMRNESCVRVTQKKKEKKKGCIDRRRRMFAWQEARFKTVYAPIRSYRERLILFCARPANGSIPRPADTLLTLSFTRLLPPTVGCLLPARKYLLRTDSFNSRKILISSSRDYSCMSLAPLKTLSLTR